MRIALIFAAFALTASSASMALEPASYAIQDPEPDTEHPAGVVAFGIPTANGPINALLYTAAGSELHPTLLLLHGFPGNEQNLDLAQAARRAGWNVLTLHYRGSWGSPGPFSFSNAAEDAVTALALLRSPDFAQSHRIDRGKIVVAGHSMGGFMAANAAANDPDVIGLFLIDAWSPVETAAGLSSPEGRAAWSAEVRSDLPPLAGTSEEALTEELLTKGAQFDLAKQMIAYGSRPLYVIGADRALGPADMKFLAETQAAGNSQAGGQSWPTDHSFSDHRIALSALLVDWLDSLVTVQD
ncbi:MAG: alpha/beta fold hydrolase [Pontixanthobacter sp.]